MLVAVIALGLLVALAHHVAWAESSSPRAPLPVGVVYTPNHNWEFPEYGGWVSLADLRAAIDEDLRIISKYFTHIRTFRAAYYGIELAPIAAKYGLKVYLGIDWPGWLEPSPLEIDAAVRAIRDHGPETIEAVLIGDSVLWREWTMWKWSEVPPQFLQRLNTLNDVVRNITAQTPGRGVKFGTSDAFNWLEEVRGDPNFGAPYLEELLHHLKKLDLIGVKMDAGFDRLTPRNFPEIWERRTRQLPVATPVFIEADTFHPLLVEWRPERGDVVRAFWQAAFDSRLDAEVDYYQGRRPTHGYFTMDRQRKLPDFPPPLDAADDPIRDLAQPVPFGCEVGVYHKVLQGNALNQDGRHVKLCLASGYNFYNPTKFDEQNIKSACKNLSCHLVIRELRKIPSSPECPFHPRMSRRQLDDWILKPFEDLCDGHGLQEKAIVVQHLKTNPMGCSRTMAAMLLNGFIAVHWKGEAPEWCEDVSKFSMAGMLVSHPLHHQELTQEVLESMCFKPSCESLMYQMASNRDTSCIPEEIHRRQRLVETFLKPYYDGCYMPTLLADVYYETGYRQQRHPPSLPGSRRIPDSTNGSVLPEPMPVFSEPTTTVVEDNAQSDSVDGSPESQAGAARLSHQTSRPPDPHNAVDTENMNATERNATKTETNASNAQSSRSPTPSKQEIRLPPFPRHNKKTPQSPDGDPEIITSNRERDHKHRRLWFWLGTGSVLLSMTAFAFTVMYKRRLRRAVQNEELETHNCYIAMAGEEGQAPAHAGGNDDPNRCPTSTLADPLLRSLFVPPGQLRDVRLIGSGGQALVYLVRQTIGPKQQDAAAVVAAEDAKANFDVSTATPHTTTKRAYRFLAAKRLPPRMAAQDTDLVLDFITEIKTVAALRHPNIVRLVGASWTTSFDLQALFEFVPGGDLGKHLSSTARYAWDETKLQVAVDVISALAYVHSLDPPLVHRDIKSRNVLLLRTKQRAEEGDDSKSNSTSSSGTSESSKDNGSSRQLGPQRPRSRLRPRLRAKLTDFGVARRHSAHATMTTGVGTSRWLAPEVILGGGAYDQSCDVYSFGVLLTELDTHALPFVERQTPSGDLLPDIALLQLIAVNGARPALSEACPMGVRRVAEACLSFDPQARPTAREVLSSLRALLDDCHDDDDDGGYVGGATHSGRP